MSKLLKLLYFFQILLSPSVQTNSFCHKVGLHPLVSLCRPVVRKHRQKQADTQASEVLNTLYAEGLRHIELDEDCRAYLSSSSASVQTKVRHGTGSQSHSSYFVRVSRGVNLCFAWPTGFDSAPPQAPRSQSKQPLCVFDSSNQSRRTCQQLRKDPYQQGQQYKRMWQKCQALFVPKCKPAAGMAAQGRTEAGSIGRSISLVPGPLFTSYTNQGLPPSSACQSIQQHL